MRFPDRHMWLPLADHREGPRPLLLMAVDGSSQGVPDPTATWHAAHPGMAWRRWQRRGGR